MAVKDRLRTMGFGLPDVGAIRSDLNEKFDRLYGVLVEIRDILRARGGQA